MSWYSDNATRRYPLDDTLPPEELVQSPTFALVDLPTPVIVDAGFLFGPLLAFDPATYVDGVPGNVYLSSIARAGNRVTFVVQSTSPLAGASLVFARDLDDPEWTTTYAEATGPDGAPLSGIPCNAPFVWRGFLATGDLSTLAAVLPDGQRLHGGVGVAFEPTLVQSLRDDYVQSISVANADRLTVATPGRPTPPYVEAFAIQQECLIGDIVVTVGYNATVDQDNETNQLTLGAAVGAGLGQPCAEVPTFPGEVPPAGSPFLSGGPPCNSLILSLNGLTNSTISLVGGEGVTVVPDPADPHGIIITL